VTALADGANTIQATYYYDAFGVHKEQTGTADNPYRYSGYMFDEESGLYYLKARFYDPELARFMQEDTYRGNSADPLSLNLYTYVSNNPLVYWDPTGHVKAGDDKLIPAAQQKIVTLTDMYYATDDPKERKKITEEADKIRQNPANKATGNSASSSSKSTIPLADAIQATQIVKSALKQIETNGKSGNKSITTSQWSTLTSSASFGGVSAKPVNHVTGAHIVQTTFAGTIATTSYNKNTQTITFSNQKNNAFWTNPTIFGKANRGEEWFTDLDLLTIAESQLLWELDKYGSIDMTVESPEKVYDISNKVLLVQRILGAPLKGSWDTHSYESLQDGAFAVGFSNHDGLTVDSSLFRALIARDAHRPQWMKGDFIRKYGIDETVMGLAMGMAIYTQASMHNGWRSRGVTEGAGKNAYDIAKEGGKHSGFYKQYVNKSPKEIGRGIQSIEKEIAEHQAKIINPEKYIPNFKDLDSRQQEALINRKWPSDIQRQQEQLDILKGIKEKLK
jgi:RHS repeat-associated protein